MTQYEIATRMRRGEWQHVERDPMVRNQLKGEGWHVLEGTWRRWQRNRMGLRRDIAAALQHVGQWRAAPQISFPGPPGAAH